MYTFLLVLQALVTLGLITVILMQKSEGGGLGTGGSPTGFLSAHGAKDFLTRTTAILATAFISLSIILAILASVGHRSSQIDTNAKAASVPNGPAEAAPPLPAPTTAVPLGGGDPLSAAAAGAATGAAPPAAGTPSTNPPAAAPGNVPMQQ